MKIKTTRFGEIEISEESILTMPDGMLGFDSCKRYVLLEDQPDVPFKWLQAVDEPSLAFIVVDPLEFEPDYNIDLPDEDAEFLGLRSPSDAAILTTVTLDKREGVITTNLLGPLVINSGTLRAKQIVLQDDRYGTKCVIGRRTMAEISLEPAAA